MCTSNSILLDLSFIVKVKYAAPVQVNPLGVLKIQYLISELPRLLWDSSKTEARY